MYMQNIDKEVEEEWLKPLWGFKQEESELETDPVHSGMKAFDMIINA